MYMPSAMRCSTAARMGLAIPSFLGMAIPYGAVPGALTRQLERAVGLLDLIGGHRRVGHRHVRAARGQRQVDRVLVVEDLDRHGLARRLALGSLGLRVDRLGRAFLHRNLVPAQASPWRHSPTTRPQQPLHDQQPEKLSKIVDTAQSREAQRAM
jgi:hypothetical protein